MELSRRAFLKLAGAAGGGVATLSAFGVKAGLADTPKTFKLKKRIGERTTICPYDASGCGFVVGVEGSKVVNIEGDPDHPINRGVACSKGSCLYQVANNPRRLTRVLYRRSGGTQWETKPWDWTIEEIAKRIKRTRDEFWRQRDDQGYIVNRTEAIASLGGAALDNEECYLLVKALRALGMVYIEHQARL